MRGRWFLIFALATPSCVAPWPYSSMATHTLRIAPDSDRDVLWIQGEHGQLFRCSQGPEGPTCQRVKF